MHPKSPPAIADIVTIDLAPLLNGAAVYILAIAALAFLLRFATMHRG